MSDGHSDSVGWYKNDFKVFCELLVQAYESKKLFPEDCGLLKKIPMSIFLDELRVPKSFEPMIEQLKNQKFDVLYVGSGRDDVELSFIWLLFLTGSFSQMIRLQKASKRFSNSLLVFVDASGKIYENGVCYQNSLFNLVDGDADILVGTAKKRGFSRGELKHGQPFLVIGQRHRHGKRFVFLDYSQP